MDFNPVDGVLWYGAFVLSTTCHEAAHAWTALKLGDDTASRGGQVSLNPLPHIRREPLGMVLMPILTWISGGWIMGWASAPFNAEWARNAPRRAAIMALAGPGANLALAIIAGLLIRIGVEWNVFVAPTSLGMARLVEAVDAGGWDFVAQSLSIFVSLNLLLCAFNLLPVPPLDGSSLPMLVLPQSLGQRYFDVLRSPILRIAGIVLITRGVGPILPPLLRAAATIIHPGVVYR
jgi:Zn-dependent protease